MEQSHGEYSSDTLDQTDEDILTYTVSDGAIEAAAGIEGGQPTQVFCWTPTRCASACLAADWS
jgi:hypothetical protein